MNTFMHIPALLNETVNAILPNKDLVSFLQKNKIEQINIIDATIGGGGHAAHFIKEFHQNQLYEKFFLNFIGIDQDEDAIQAASQKLESLQTTCSRFKYKIYHTNFSDLSAIVAAVQNKRSNSPATSVSSRNIHGLYADFGVSSPQLDRQERGFSFLHEGPVDMRMNQKNPQTAADILMTYDEQELARIFYEYGEEPKSRLLARAIVADRKQSKLPLENTKIFAEYVKKILKYGYSRTHPATKIFQALRIEVNNELHAIQTMLETVPQLLCPHAQAGFISFHSLEDRLVKRTMRLWQERGFGRETPRGGIISSPQDIADNPRARSARLRVFDFVE